jgi:hypothetical protein
MGHVHYHDLHLMSHEYYGRLFHEHEWSLVEELYCRVLPNEGTLGFYCKETILTYLTPTRNSQKERNECMLRPKINKIAFQDEV